MTLVVDRSGSMMTCRDDAEGGINAFIEEQKANDGECNLTLVQFDNVYEFVHNGVPVADVGEFKLHPRGGTALLDAVGRAINEAGTRLAKMPESERPGLVTFVIVTDGQENASREFSRDQIKKMIEEQTSKYNWQFTFLGADANAFKEAASIGIPKSASGVYSTQSADKVFLSASANVTRMRSASMAGEAVSCSYTDAERAAMKGSTK